VISTIASVTVAHSPVQPCPTPGSPWPARDGPQKGSDLGGLRWRRLLRDIGRMSFWACAQIDARHERLAMRCLSLSGHVVYQPRIKSPRRESEPLFANYLFVAVELQWHLIRWSPGVMKLIMAGEQPARVPDAVIDGLHARERNQRQRPRGFGLAIR
jgi:transcription antitermination factor NusG